MIVRNLIQKSTGIGKIFFSIGLRSPSENLRAAISKQIQQMHSIFHRLGPCHRQKANNFTVVITGDFDKIYNVLVKIKMALFICNGSGRYPSLN